MYNSHPDLFDVWISFAGGPWEQVTTEGLTYPAAEQRMKESLLYHRSQQRQVKMEIRPHEKES